jgi:GNAT superfamily N-acetyltransferase
MTNNAPLSPSRPAAGPVVAMEARHLPGALALSQSVEWPYRLEDWEIAWRLGRGFVVEADGEVIATALWWPYGPAHATVGMIIVADKAQRQGIGARLMDALLADAAGRTIILNSTVEGRVLYTRLGFVPFDQVHQHQTVLATAPALDPTVPIRAATGDELEAMIDLDEAGAGMNRAAMLSALTESADTLVIEREGGITGYGCVRRWGRGHVVGPVVARDAVEARALIAALAARRVGDFVRIDVTLSSGLSPWLEGIGLPRVNEVVTMALGEPPRASEGANLFALANQSLG